jgi:phytoene dehydrogenase-like protein
MNVIIGAGVGGLAAATALARAGEPAMILEGRASVGGLASGIALEGVVHDGGPYILLDRPGLSWAFERLGADLDTQVDLIHLDDEVYRVTSAGHPSVSIFADLHRTASTLEAQWPGSGAAYEAWISRMTGIYDNLVELQRDPRPGAWKLLKKGRFREGLFLLQGLAAHLERSGLPQPVRDALGIWTHIAGQPLAEAPAPLAFVPAIIHTHGAYVVRGGMARIVEALRALAVEAGVEIRCGTRVDRIVRDGSRVLGVEAGGQRISAERVFSNAPGIGTYVELLHPPEPTMSAQLSALPLQSPGVAAYLDMTVDDTVPFLQFWLPPPGPTDWTRVLVNPGAYDPDRSGQGRLVSPTRHAWANNAGEEGQRAFLDHILAESWWRHGVQTHRVLATRIPKEWGRQYLLYRDSMNPVMTASFMRRGRLSHKSPVADNLYLAGSATHPGQWVSFCSISGILAVEEALARR